MKTKKKKKLEVDINIKIYLIITMQDCFFLEEIQYLNSFN